MKTIITIICMLFACNIYAQQRQEGDTVIDDRVYRYIINRNGSEHSCLLSPVGRQPGVDFRRMTKQIVFDIDNGKTPDDFNELYRQTMASFPNEAFYDGIREILTDEELANTHSLYFNYKIDLSDGQLYDVYTYHQSIPNTTDNLVTLKKLHELIVLTENAKYEIAEGFADYFDYSYIPKFITISASELREKP